MFQIEEITKTTPEHKAKCKEVMSIMKSWIPHMPFTWEWQRGVQFCGKMTAGDEDIPLAVRYTSYNHVFDILVAPSALELSPEDLEIGVLHELGHIFISNLKAIHFNEVVGDSEAGLNNWFDHEEEACWRFAKMLYSTKKAKK